MKLGRAILAAVALFTASGSVAAAAVFDLSFSGLTDGSVFRLDGVPIALGTPFEVIVTIDDAPGAPAYDVLDVRGSIGGTEFTTIGPWDIPDLIAVQETGAVVLSNGALFPINSAGETFGIDGRVTGSGVLATDPTTWAGLLAPGLFFDSADILVFASGVDVSTGDPYGGTLLLTVSEPGEQTIVVEPDLSTVGTDISNLVEGVTLSAQGGDTSDNFVYAVDSFAAPTGQLSFGWFDDPFFDDHWGRSSSPTLRADFSGFLAREVSIDYQADSGTVTVEAFGSGGGSLGTVSAGPGTGTLTYAAGENAIESVEFEIEAVGGADIGSLDHLVIRVPEPGRTLLALAAFVVVGLRRRRASAMR